MLGGGRTGWSTEGPRQSHDAFEWPGIGLIKYDQSLNRLSAHYAWGNDKSALLRVGRSCRPSTQDSDRRRFQGQPIGFLLAWLSAPRDFPAEFGNIRAHHRLSEFQMRNPAMSLELRRRLRQEAMDVPGLRRLLDMRVAHASVSAPRHEPDGVSY